MLDQIWPYVTAAVTFAAAIAAITPTKKDNAILNIVLRFINTLAINVGQARNADDNDESEKN